jgi:hypothetical protein
MTAHFLAVYTVKVATGRAPVYHDTKVMYVHTYTTLISACVYAVCKCVCTYRI